MEKPNAFIEQLVSDLPNRSPSRNWGARYVAYWIFWVGVMALVTCTLNVIWPNWLRPPTELTDVGFAGKMALYLAATTVFARLAYLYSVPGVRLTTWRRVAAMMAFTLVGGVLFLSPADPRGFMTEFRSELDLAVGPCGFFILTIAFAIGGALRIAARRGLATDVRAAAGWTFAATACLASVSAEVLCRHESPTHMLLWHLIPFALATCAGAAVANRFEKAHLNM